MPLPPNTTLSLLGHSRPGDTAPSKPKQAMIVRMSAETLDALDSSAQQPQMKFEFGDTPGIYIGDTFFPMQPLKEETPHELYLRTSLAAKPSLSLKLYANVTGKFTVERQFGDKVKDMLREKTMDAAKQRERATIFINAPSEIIPTPSRKRQPPSMFRKTLQPKPPPPAPPSHAKASSPVPPRPIKAEHAIPLRRRLIHCIAVSNRTQDQVVRLIGGRDCDAAGQREILDLLEEVAQPVLTDKNQNKPWCLKLESWKEVRPYEWPKLSEDERTNMARAARRALQTLHIPESDPAWDHVRYRNIQQQASTSPSTASPSKSTSRGTDQAGNAPRLTRLDAPKRGVTTREMKERKAKPKADPKAPVQMKDERMSASSSAANGTSRDAQARLAAKLMPPARKLPGSGYQAGKFAPQNRRTELPSETLRLIPSQTDSRLKVEEKDARNLLPSRSSLSSVKRETNAASVRRISQSRRTDADSDRDALDDRARDYRGSLPKNDDLPPTKEGSGKVIRKKRAVDDEEATPAAKRRKAGNELSVPSTSNRDTSAYLQKNSELSLLPARTTMPQETSLPKMLKEHLSSSRPSAETWDSKDSALLSLSPKSRTSTRTSSSKPRRPPVYTSSEDEGKLVLPINHASKAVALPTPPTNAGAVRSRPSAPRGKQPLSSNHAEMRERYRASYLEYITVFQKLLTQKSKIDHLLKHGDVGSTSSVTDSDADVELLDSEELAKLSLEHKRLQNELETIREVFTQSEALS